MTAPAEPLAPAKKKRENPSLNPMTLKHLRDNGYEPIEVVEKWLRFPDKKNPRKMIAIRQDLFGFIDIIAGIPGGGTLAVQVCSGGRAAGDRGEDDAGRGSDVGAREAKIREHANLRGVLAMGWKVVIHAWRKNAAGRWELREVPITEPAPLPPTPFDP